MVQVGLLVLRKPLTLSLFHFSAFIAKLRRYTGAAGIPPIVPPSANRSIGIENTNDSAEENADLKFKQRVDLSLVSQFSAFTLNSCTTYEPLCSHKIYDVRINLWVLLLYILCGYKRLFS